MGVGGEGEKDRHLPFTSGPNINIKNYNYFFEKILFCLVSSKEISKSSHGQLKRKFVSKFPPPLKKISTVPTSTSK